MFDFHWNFLDELLIGNDGSNKIRFILVVGSTISVEVITLCLTTFRLAFGNCRILIIFILM